MEEGGRDFGFWILDFGFWILDFGFWIVRELCVALGEGEHRTSDVEPKTAAHGAAANRPPGAQAGCGEA